MKKKKIYLLFFCIIFVLTGCKGTIQGENENYERKEVENNSEEIEGPTLVERDVVFLTKEYGFYKPSVLGLGGNMLYTCYETKENPDALYAFRISNIYYSCKEYEVVEEPIYGIDYTKTIYPADYPIREKNETDEAFRIRLWNYKFTVAREILLQEGFYLLADESINEVVFAGTIENVYRVFREMKMCDGWCLEADSVVCPEGEIFTTEELQISVKVPLLELKGK